MSNPYNSPPLPQPRSGRKWWVLGGCGGCLGIIVAGVAMLFGIVTYSVKNSDLYPEVQKRAQDSAALESAIGHPLEYGMMFQGSVSTKNGAKSMDISIPVSGPKGSASLVVKAYKPVESKTWEYSVLEAHLKDGKVIDLNTPATAGGAPGSALAP